MIRVVIDANVLISYLLAPASSSAPNEVIRALFNHEFAGFLSEITVTEVQNKVREKPWLRDNIGVDAATDFLDRLRTVATVESTGVFPGHLRSRDADDDYLIAHALQVDADMLVTGDKDLLVLVRVFTVHIVTPRELIDLLAMG